jgi:hypothetical protein
VFGNSFDGPVGQVQVAADVVVVVWYDLVAVTFDESFVLFVHLIATFFKVVLSPIVSFILYTLALFCCGFLFFLQPSMFSFLMLPPAPGRFPCVGPEVGVFVWCAK